MQAGQDLDGRMDEVFEEMCMLHAVIMLCFNF
jgi:hypothetical protein